MSGKCGCFHSNHGHNIRLKEGGTEAHRVESYNKAVVFTEQPIPHGGMFTIKLLDKGGGWAGSIRFGFTLLSPDNNIPVPSGALDLYRSSDYWILSASTVHHNGQENKVDFNLESLRVGQTVSCSVNKEGELRYYIDGQDQGLGWSGVPTDKPLWGFADIYGLARKIKSEFLCDEVMSCSEDSDAEVTG
ncbi:neuralized-like protein 4 [Halichondria panicea]|uniref:neuralized-like protein 4 n=1 Tax=Halichondria panicea TaxID=6063 RepID=UPI00312B5BE4